ncbi:unnamed protein product [Darwinula stevensoni]|uniref:Uncharacterized protein n=1 Tax=Darwinula stevensoni TaxID=69355 RepID=A0A7R9A0Q2_9CRUS|nr:unnamed protein product [Darwinula stevensoni]CAG0881715.1 unnamed protein product [Darwinula stevensoni]
MRSSCSGTHCDLQDGKEDALVIIVGGLLVGLLLFFLQNPAGKDGLSGYDSRKGEHFTCPRDTRPRLNCSRTPTLLIVSMNGFRPDFLTEEAMPRLFAFARCGVSTPYMRTSFPARTLANHYSIVTGKRAAAYYWPGADSDMTVEKPNYWLPYNENTPYLTRVEQVLRWLNMTDALRPHLVQLFIEDPERTAETYDVRSKQMEETLRNLDVLIGMLLDSLENIGWKECLNVVFLSAHGTISGSKNHVIDLRKRLKNNYVAKTVVAQGSLAMIWFTDSTTSESRLQLLKELECRNPNLTIYRRDQAPKRQHYFADKWKPDWIAEAQPGWQILAGGSKADVAVHGYDTIYPSMNGIFIASGPAFKRRVKVPPFQNIELYNIFCRILDLRPARNNGTTGALHEILSETLTRRFRDKDYDEEKEKLSPPILYPRNERSTSCGCSLSSKKSSSLEKSEKAEIEKRSNVRHIPFGAPLGPTEDNFSIIQLIQRTFVTGFSPKLKQDSILNPKIDLILFSYTVNESRILNYSCWFADQGLPGDEQTRVDPCWWVNAMYSHKSSSSSPLLPGTLFPFGVEGEISSALVPSPQGFPAGNAGRETLKRLIAFHGPGLHLHLGVVFDSIHVDAIADPPSEVARSGIPPVPSDIFVIGTFCRSRVKAFQCPHSDLDVMSFILPNVDNISPCQSLDEWIIRHSATVRDVELASGLRFYPKLPPLDSLRLRLRLPELSWRNIFSKDHQINDS